MVYPLDKLFNPCYDSTMANYEPTPEDLDLLDSDLRDRVERGEVLMLHPSVWDSPYKPVLRAGGKAVKGTGRVKGAQDIGEASQQTAYRRTKAYNEGLEALIPVNREDSAEAIISLRELVAEFWEAAVGKGVNHKCPDCGTVSYVRGAQKDPHALMKMIERLTGRAKETTEVNVRSEHLHRLLNERTDVREIDVISIDPGEERRRREVLGDPDLKVIDTDE